MTPDEFNKVGNQVQLEIFEKYFEDLNQLTRVPQNDMDYADRVAYLDQKIAVFKTNSTVNFSNGQVNLPSDLHVLGAISANDIELQRVSRNEYYNIIKSPLTKPTLSYPIYLLEGKVVKISPAEVSSVDFDYVKKPSFPTWAYSVGSVGQFIYDDNNSVDFELHSSEQTEIVLRILAYAGIIIRDPSIVQTAMAQVQQTNINEKS